MKYYNKLIRDKIPEIMRNAGKEFKLRLATDDEYDLLLKKKLIEECYEYYKSGEAEELADIIEVIIAILTNNNMTYNELEIIRLNKMWERGSFTKKIVLEYAED